MSAEIQRKIVVNWRRADKALPPPACRNCTGFIYDASERMGMRGEFTEKIDQRCAKYCFRTTTNCVCDKHEFKYPDHRDI